MEVKSTGKPYQQFDTGSQRDSDEGKSRPDLVDPFFIDRVGTHLAKGAGKYGEWNWYLGQPTARSAASLKRHIQAWEMGEIDEDHLAAVAFGIMNIWRAERLAEMNPAKYGHLLDAIHYANYRERVVSEVDDDLLHQVRANIAAEAKVQFFLSVHKSNDDIIEIEITRDQYDQLHAEGLGETTGARVQVWQDDEQEEKEVVEALDGPTPGETLTFTTTVAEFNYGDALLFFGDMMVGSFNAVMEEAAKLQEDVDKFLAAYSDEMRDEELAFEAVVEAGETGEDTHIVYQRLRVAKYPGNNDKEHPNEWSGDGCSCKVCTEARTRKADRLKYEAINAAGAWKPEKPPKPIENRKTVYDDLFPEFSRPFYTSYGFMRPMTWYDPNDRKNYLINPNVLG